MSESSAPVKKMRKRSSKLNVSFSTYIYRKLKSTAPGYGMTKKSMAVVNDITVSITRRLVEESGKLCRLAGRQTVSPNDVRAAVKLLLSPKDVYDEHELELLNHTLNEMTKAQARFSAASA